MKKTLALLLILSMLLSFAACSSSKKQAKENNDTTAKQTEKIEDKTPENNSPRLVKGKLYKNTLLDLSFRKPDTWKFSTDEELASKVKEKADSFKNEENYNKLLKRHQTVYDMMAVDSATNTNVQVLIDNLERSNTTGITEKNYIAALAAGLAKSPSMSVRFEYYDSKTVSTKKVKLGDNEYLRAVAQVTLNGVGMLQIYYVRKIEKKYMACVIITIPDGYTITQVEKMFG